MLAGMQQGFRKSGSQTWMPSETKLASWIASLQVPLERQVKGYIWCPACMRNSTPYGLWSSHHVTRKPLRLASRVLSQKSSRQAIILIPQGMMLKEQRCWSWAAH